MSQATVYGNSISPIGSPTAAYNGSMFCPPAAPHGVEYYHNGGVSVRVRNSRSNSSSLLKHFATEYASPLNTPPPPPPSYGCGNTTPPLYPPSYGDQRPFHCTEWQQSILPFPVACVTRNDPYRSSPAQSFVGSASPTPVAAADSTSGERWRHYWQEQHRNALLNGATIPNGVVVIETIDDCAAVCGALLDEARGVYCDAKVEARGQSLQNNATVQLHDMVVKLTDQQAPLSVRPRCFIGVDIEREDLGRNGTITVVSVATKHTVFVFDLGLAHVHGAAPLLLTAGRLGEVLEDPQLHKLMFDCRADADALYSKYGVSIRNVCDLQVMATLATSPKGRYLAGMQKVFLKLNIFDTATEAVRLAAVQLFDPTNGGSYECWHVRPLLPQIAAYCAVNVQHYFIALYMLHRYVRVGCRIGQQRLDSVRNGMYHKNKDNNQRDWADAALPTVEGPQHIASSVYSE